ncbi:Signal transduction histidine kinase [Anaerovirgula multivorans]|uniref:histidine kinase n=1 Tax=Anaerovirgula multivorans TaxID=312168 RepID=A0A239F2U6_9FIRM|nr:HAMP domain-containing sensor histidine kinase [Anaerovirgula multivorans]SNS50492.1 Signal transduction histidine kinase [Anaerovirgula multivorans]
MDAENLMQEKKYMISALVLFITSILWPIITEAVWFNIVVQIREAINTGDSGQLILASATSSILFTTQNTLLFLSVVVGGRLLLNQWILKENILLIVQITCFVMLNIIISKMLSIPWEPITTIVAMISSCYLIRKGRRQSHYFFQSTVVSIQVFFAFQWLNIMPIFSVYRFGQSDIPISIKIAGVYLNSSSVLNFIGFSFFIPLFFSAVITSTLFQSHAQNIAIVKENYLKERALESMKTKAMGNRVYLEINSLAHDLKTPLVTIRGLNSLLLISGNQEKLQDYCNKIENAVEKMSEMVTSFLYGSSRQKMKVEKLITYIRAQIPVEDEKLKLEIDIEEGLSEIYVNKVRVVRALINLIENAIIVPCNDTYKKIIIEVKGFMGGIRISIIDNGMGIKPSDLPHVWEIGHSTNNTTGLGLPFAKQIIEENDGKIEIASILEEGTRVNVFFPSVDREIEE